MNPDLKTEQKPPIERIREMLDWMLEDNRDHFQRLAGLATTEDISDEDRLDYARQMNLYRVRIQAVEDVLRNIPKWVDE